MATQNFFALLGDHENEDPASLIERYRAEEKPQPKKAPPSARNQQTPAALPSKPLPPSESVRDAQRAQGRVARGGSRGGRTGFGERDQDRKESYLRSGENGFPSAGKGNVVDRNDNSEQNEVGGYGGGRGSYQRGRGGYGGRGRAGSYGVSVESGTSNQEKEEVGGDYEGARDRGRVRGRGRGFGRGDDDQIRGREYDRRSGSGRGYEMKREGSGRYNWGSERDQQPIKEEVPSGVSPVKEENNETQFEQKTEEPTKDEPLTEDEVAKPQEEDNEMTLDEYERVLDEKRKGLSALKTQERKVDADKSFQKMQLVDKKNAEDVFIKLGFDKEKGKKKEAAEKEDKAKKAVSINEFLKPVDGETYYGAGNGRGRGRGRGGIRGGFNSGYANSRVSAPSIEDPGHFPTLGAN